MISHTANKPVPNKTLQKYHDLSIILFYKHKAIGILKYYRPATNLCWIKKQVNYQMRYSLCAREERHESATPCLIDGIIKMQQCSKYCKS